MHSDVTGEGTRSPLTKTQIVFYRASLFTAVALAGVNAVLALVGYAMVDAWGEKSGSRELLRELAVFMMMFFYATAGAVLLALAIWGTVRSSNMRVRALVLWVDLLLLLLFALSGVGLIYGNRQYVPETGKYIGDAPGQLAVAAGGVGACVAGAVLLIAAHVWMRKTEKATGDLFDTKGPQKPW